MKTRSVFAALLLATLNLPLSTAHAQSTAFTYQGRLDDGGSPASGIYDLRFALFAAPDAGEQQGITLTQTATAVTNGLFTSTLDFGNQFPGADRWLEIAVRTNGGGAFSTLAPRQALTPTPYAVFAGKVNASGISGTLAPGNIANGTITTLMLANGAVGANQLAAGAVTTTALANGAVTATKVATVSNWFALTIANPIPEQNELFGNAVAAVGSDRLLIGAPADNTGAPDAGVAYLFSNSGPLLTTFTNPTPEFGDQFGRTVAALRSDRVLIGAPADNTGAQNAGAAYLFGINGTLLATFNNPTPVLDEFFGSSVAALGSDRVLIGAKFDSTFALNAGAAYLFSTNGTLLATFPNPTPAADDNFGSTVAALGSDRVLIGASGDDTGASGAGAAYLFSINGTLLTTFNNPAPAAGDVFGTSVAALGSDRVIIGAPEDSFVGRAYLFSTNGALLASFRNPVLTDEFFGSSVAALGSDRVIIGGARNSIVATWSGAAYLFSTNGTLLTTFNNPTPAAGDFFGNAVAALGNDRVFIGAEGDDTGVQAAGAAYLFSTETFTDGLVADAVRARSVTTASLEDGAVTAAKIGGALFASQIPELDASKITSGTLADARIPNLDASKITSGTFKRLTVAGAGAFNNANAAAIILDNTTPVTGRRWEWHALDDGGMQVVDFTAGLPRLLISTNGDVGLGETSPGARLDVRTALARVALFNRTGDDGVLVNWQREGFNVGSVSVAAGVVSYNAFTGSHYAWTEEAIERGMLVAMTGDNRRTAGGNTAEIIYGVTRTQTANDPRCLGAYLGLEEPSQPASDQNPHQIMSVGNGEMWVTASGGDLEPGDALITSAVPGCAMKDDPTQFPIGHIIARAADRVDWATVPADRHGVKRTKISVLFTNYERHIATVDADGVALAAIQGLNQKLEDRSSEWEDRGRKLETSLEQKQTEITEMKTLNAALLRRLEALEARLK